jgi:hypothetical protein
MAVTDTLTVKAVTDTLTVMAVTDTLTVIAVTDMLTVIVKLLVTVTDNSRSDYASLPSLPAHAIGCIHLPTFFGSVHGALCVLCVLCVGGFIFSFSTDVLFAFVKNDFFPLLCFLMLSRHSVYSHGMRFSYHANVLEEMLFIKNSQTMNRKAREEEKVNSRSESIRNLESTCRKEREREKNAQ